MACLPRHRTWHGKGGYRHAARPPLVSPALLLPQTARPLQVHNEETQELSALLESRRSGPRLVPRNTTGVEYTFPGGIVHEKVCFFK